MFTRVPSIDTTVSEKNLLTNRYPKKPTNKFQISKKREKKR